MADFRNLGFEDAGAGPGAADGWDVAETFSGDVMGTFSGVPDGEDDAVEAFRRGWGLDSYEFSLLPNVAVFPGLFNQTVVDGDTREGFDKGWSLNHFYAFSLGSVVVGEFSGGSEVEDFGAGWVDGYEFDGAANLQGFFSGILDGEYFQAGWDNDSYEWALGTVYEPVVGLFDEGSQIWEAFVDPKFDLAVAADPATDTFTAASHEYSDGDRVEFARGIAPGGVVPGYLYFVVSATTGTFKVSAAAGGSPVDVTSAGLGPVVVRSDPARHWRDRL